MSASNTVGSLSSASSLGGAGDGGIEHGLELVPGRGSDREPSAVGHGDPAAGEGCAIYHELVRVALAGDDPVGAVPTVLALIPPPHRERYTEVLSAGWVPDRSALPNGTVWGALATADDWIVLSLCRTKGHLDDRPVRREVYLVDDGNQHNPALREALDDVLDTLDALRTAGETVVVHCHAGRSRTGLVLRAWLMRSEGLSVAATLAESRRLWPHVDTWNAAFTEVLAELEWRR